MFASARERVDFDAVLRRGLDVIFIVSFVFLLLILVWDFHNGGDRWRQGDWLINNHEVTVRRGILGDWFLDLADVFGVSPLGVVFVVEAVGLAGLFWAFRRLVVGIDIRVGALLALSPAVFVLFWMADPVGGMRKELIAFLAISLLALGVVERHARFVVAGLLLYGVSVIGHEAMALFLPTVLGLAYLAGRAGVSRGLVVTGALGVSAITGLALNYAMRFPRVADTESVCHPLIERGLSHRICEGAIEWLRWDTSQVEYYVAHSLTPGMVAGFALGYVAALVPLAVVAAHAEHPLRRLSLLVVTVVPFVVLYVVAADWGRWISFHAFSFVVLMAVALRMDVFRMARRIRPQVVIGLVVLAVLLTPSHFKGVHVGGAVRQLAEAIIDGPG